MLSSLPFAFLLFCFSLERMKIASVIVAGLGRVAGVFWWAKKVLRGEIWPLDWVIVQLGLVCFMNWHANYDDLLANLIAPLSFSLTFSLPTGWKVSLTSLIKWTFLHYFKHVLSIIEWKTYKTYISYVFLLKDYIICCQFLKLFLIEKNNIVL